MLKYNNPTDFVLASGKSYSVKQFVNLSCEYLNLKTKWIGSGNDEKLPAGPIISPSPGPTLATAVIAPLRLVMRSSPSRL